MFQIVRGFFSSRLEWYLLFFLLFRCSDFDETRLCIIRLVFFFLLIRFFSFSFSELNGSILFMLILAIRRNTLTSISLIYTVCDPTQ